MQSDSSHTVITYQTNIAFERNAILERLPDWLAKVHERSDLFCLDTYLGGIIGKSSSSVEVILRNAISVIVHKTGQSGQDMLRGLIPYLTKMQAFCRQNGLGPETGWYERAIAALTT